MGGSETSSLLLVGEYYNMCTHCIASAGGSKSLIDIVVVENQLFGVWWVI